MGKLMGMCKVMRTGTVCERDSYWIGNGQERERSGTGPGTPQEPKNYCN